MPDRQFVPKNRRETNYRSPPPKDELPVAPRVLAADDDPGMRLLMEETLAKAGFNVYCTASGSEAIDACREFKPDLVLLDINMPVMDGITACVEIRKQSGVDFPVVMVTSADDATSVQRAFDAGATDFIVKPINWPLFQRRLNSVLQEWNQAQEVDENNRRVGLLKKVVPHKVLLVARSGEIIDDLKSGTKNGDEREVSSTLEQLYGRETARRFKQRISGVLKTGRANNLDFKVVEQGIDIDYEAQFLTEGRDRVIVVVQHGIRESQSNNEIYDLAFLDLTSGLPNRHLFERVAEEQLVDARLKGQTPVFICVGFEQLSEAQKSDAVIMEQIAANLDDCLAAFDNVAIIGRDDHSARVARIGSNRFMLLLRRSASARHVDAVCKAIVAKLTGSIVSDTASIDLTPRLGIASYPADGSDLESLVRAASSALREALQTGNRICFNSQPVIKPRLDTEDYGEELRQALEQDALELYFQPRLSLADGNITCIEALLRWNHPMRGFVDLAEVLNLAKATGLIGKLGDWVLKTACNEAHNWQFDPLPRVSVNLSQQEFSRHDLAERVLDVLENTGLAPDRIDLELTEAALLRAQDGLTDLQTLKALGVGLVLDDFGTGHTSLSNLKLYPIDALKIDGSFVRELPDNAKDAAICEVIITMAHLLGMHAVAEGVETEEQLTLLRSLGCDEAQGYHICKPLPASEVAEFFMNNSAATAERSPTTS